MLTDAWPDGCNVFIPVATKETIDNKISLKF